ncbi:MAG: glycosyltransferase [Phycisphaerales bacterium]
MRIVFTPVGSHGDIHPSIALARALNAAPGGHEGIVVTNPYYQRVVEDAGVRFVALGERMELAEAAQTPGAMSGHFGSFKLLKRLVLPEIPNAAKDFEKIARELKPDGVIAHPLALAAPMVCEKLDIRWGGTALAPVSWLNYRDQPVLSPWQHATPPLLQSKIALWGGGVLMRWVMDGPLNTVRREMGLPKAKDQFITLCKGGVVNLGLWSPIFRGPLEGDPATGVITGFPWFDVVKEQSGDLERLFKFLDAGEPPILFSLGTAAVHVSGQYYSAAAEACRILKKRGLLLVGKREYAPRTLPAGVEAFTYAPYSQVFPRCLAIVHHGGIGTTAQSLRAGRPLLITPMAHDQFDNAAKVKRLGVGLRVGHARATPEKLVQRLTHLLGDESFAKNAAAVAPKIAAEDGVGNAVRAMEKAFL